MTNGGLGVIAEDLPGRFSAGPGSRVFHRGAPGFDMTLLEVLIASASGGATLVLAKNEELFGSGLASALRRERITHLCATPTVVASIGDPSLPDLSTVMFGGERLGGALAKRWQAGRRVINGYGPAESTMYSLATEPLSIEPLSIEQLSADTHDGSIGYPLAGGVDASCSMIDSNRCRRESPANCISQVECSLAVTPANRPELRNDSWQPVQAPGCTGPATW